MGGSNTSTVNFKPTVSGNASASVNSFQNGSGSRLNFDPNTSQNGSVRVNSVNNSGTFNLGLQQLMILPVYNQRTFAQ